MALESEISRWNGFAKVLRKPEVPFHKDKLPNYRLCIVFRLSVTNPEHDQASNATFTVKEALCQNKNFTLPHQRDLSSFENMLSY